MFFKKNKHAFVCTELIQFYVALPVKKIDIKNKINYLCMDFQKNIFNIKPKLIGFNAHCL